MKQAHLRQIKTALAAEAQELTQRLGRFTAASAHDRDAYGTRFPQFGTKEDENAAEVASFDDNLGLKQKLEQSLGEVQAALAKIEDGTYGTCSNCGSPIDEARLIAQPAATRCLRCQSLQSA